MREIKHLGIMIDCETLGLDPNAVCLEIAAVPFDMDNPEIESILEIARGYLPMDPQVNMGRSITASTFKFWMEQPGDARMKVTKNLEGNLSQLENTVHRIMRLIRGWMHEPDRITVMCRGTDFDLPILASLCAMTNVEIPWEYNQTMCLRTLCNKLGISTKDITPPLDYVKHSALSDCKFQILQYAAVHEKLEGIG